MININLQSPVMTHKKFAEESGLREAQVRGQMQIKHLPKFNLGKLAMVNVAKLMVMCLEESEDQSTEEQK